MLSWFAPQIPLYGIGVVAAGALQARQRFAWPALVPLLSSLVVIGAYVAYGRMAPPGATGATLPDGALVALAERPLQRVDQTVLAKSGLRITAGQKLVQQLVRDRRLLASRHTMAPSAASYGPQPRNS